ncbi:MAG: hypothetical protein V1729_07000 [Candidatus Woesearchaeota archaeon]
MGLFSKKEDTRYVKEFDNALHSIDSLAKEFRESHFASLTMFGANFRKDKDASDLEKERKLFERHMEVLQKLKFQTDLLVDEAFKIVRNESALTEKDRQELMKIMAPKPKTGIKVPKKE